jgi:hypothetical protein
MKSSLEGIFLFPSSFAKNKKGDDMERWRKKRK